MIDAGAGVFNKKRLAHPVQGCVTPENVNHVPGLDPVSLGLLTEPMGDLPGRRTEHGFTKQGGIA